MNYYLEIQFAQPQFLTLLSISFMSQLLQLTGQQFSDGNTQYTITDITPGAVTVTPATLGPTHISYGDGFGDLLTTDVSGSTPVFTLVVNYQLISTASGVQAQLALQATINITLSLAASVTSVQGSIQFASPTLSITPGATTFEGSDAALVAADTLATPMQNALTPLQYPLALGSYQVSNVGAAFDSTGQVLALRMQIGLSNDEDEVIGLWNPFFAGHITNHLGSPDGSVSGNSSVFISSPVMVELVSQAIEGGVAQHADTLTMQGGITTNWAPTSTGVAHLDSDFIIVTNTGSIHADIKIGSDIGIPPPSAALAASTCTVATELPVFLQVHSHVDWTVDPGDEVKYVILAGVLGFLAGGLLTGGLGAIPGFAIGMIGAIIGFAAFTPNLAAPQCTQSGHDMTCISQICVSPSPYSMTTPIVQFQSAWGYPEGLVLLTTFNLSAIFKLYSLRMYLEGKHFNFQNGLRSLNLPTISVQILGSAP